MKINNTTSQRLSIKDTQALPVRNFCTQFNNKSKPSLMKTTTLTQKLCFFAITLLFALSSMAQTQIISTFAGTGSAGYSGDGGQATAAVLNHPIAVLTDAVGNTYIADYDNNVVRKVSASGIISTIAGNGSSGYSGDGGVATAATFANPVALAIDAVGNLYVADEFNNAIRRINTSGIITTVAGNGVYGYSGDGGLATAARLAYPAGLAIDASGNLFIGDYYNSAIRKVNLGTGIISTIAGNGTAGYSGDGGLATAAKLNQPWGISFDTQGNLYIADYNNNAIRKINTSGIISTICGNGTGGYTGNGGIATAATLYQPSGVVLDGTGNIYIADAGNSVIRQINSTGIINTMAGNGTAGYSGDGGTATSAQLNLPYDVTLSVDASGNLFIADFGNNVVRKVTIPPPPSSPPNINSYVTPGGVFDTLFDRFGNKYPIKTLQTSNINSSKADTVNIGERVIAHPSFGATLTTPAVCGNFNLYFEIGSGVENYTNTTTPDYQRYLVLCQVYTDISDLVNLTGTSTQVNIWVRSIDNIVYPPGGVLGLATSFYAVAGASTCTSPMGGIVDGQVWKTIISGTDAYTGIVPPLSTPSFTAAPSSGAYYHGMMAFNFDLNSSGLPYIDWNLSLTTQPLVGQYDLYSVMLHEITHALGFASLINGNGQSKFGCNYQNYYSRYDLNLKTQVGYPITNSVPLIVNPTGCNSMYDYEFNPLLNPANTIYPNPTSAPPSYNQTDCSTAVHYVNSLYNVPVYTPNFFQAPSTFSHFEDECYPTVNPSNNDKIFCMSNAENPGPGLAKAHLTNEERSVLCDLGYITKTTFGVSGNLSSTTYTDATCPGIGVAGVNDGIVGGSYIYTAPAGTNLTIPITGLNGVLTNDFNAATMNCLQIVYPFTTPGTVSVASQITYVPASGYTGPVVLRYVPKSSTGALGNITYISAYILDPTCTPPDPCNMVQNGGFENMLSTTVYQCGDSYNPGSGIQTTDVKIGCWYRTFDTPDLFTRNCATSGDQASTDAGMFNLGTLTFSATTGPFPGGTPIAFDSRTGPLHGNDRILGLFEGNVTSGGYVEVMQNALGSPLIPGTSYVLSFWAYNFNGTMWYPSNNSPITVPPTNWQLNINNTTGSGLTGQIVSFAAYSGPYPIPVAGSTGTFPVTSGTYPMDAIHDFTVSTTNQWTLMTYTFTYAPASGNNDNTLLVGTNYNANILAGYTRPYTSFTHGVHNDFHYVLIDDVSLLPLNTAPTFSLPAVITCANASVGLNLGQYATPPGGTFSGPGVSQTGGVYNFNPAIAGNGLQTIVYTYVNSSTGCTLSVSQQVQVNISLPLITASVSPTNTVCAGTVVNLSASGGATYAWSPSIACLNIPCSAGPVAPSATTIYTVTGTDAGGVCSNVATVTVNVTPSCCMVPHKTLTIPSIGANSSSLSSTSLTGGTVGIFGNFTINSPSFSMTNIPHVLMAANVKIIIMPACTLTISNCNLYTCGNTMWDGIEIQPGGMLIMENGSLVEDALIAVHSFNSGATAGSYSLNTTKFNRNYTGVQVEPYSGAGVVHPGIIQNCTFDCKASTVQSYGQILKIPYATQTYGQYGVNLINVNSIQIGDPSTVGDLNRFFYLYVGIRAVNSVYTAYNNLFKNNYVTPICLVKIPPPGYFCPNSSWAIWATNCNSLIGGALVNQLNTFHTLNNAILADNGGPQLQVLNNVFRTIDVGSVNPSSGYGVHATGFHGVYVTINNNDIIDIVTAIFYGANIRVPLTVNNNLFKNFTYQGVYCVQNTYGSMGIGGNTFNDATTTYNGNVAINAANTSAIPYGSSPSLHAVNNSILRINEGIQVVYLSNPTVTTNTITFAGTITPNPNFYYGIRTQSCNSETVTANIISKNGANPTLGAELYEYGISVETNANFALVKQNDVSTLGTGIRFYNNTNPNATMQCNIMTHNWSGLTLANANIGPQGQAVSLTYPTGLANDNQWSTIPSGMAGSESVKGYPPNYNPIFYTRAAGFPWSPNQTTNMSPINTISDGNNISYRVPNAPQNCPNICYSPPCNQLALVKVAKKQSPFDTISGVTKFVTNQAVLRTVLADSSLTDNSASGHILSNFRDSMMLNSNAGLVEKAAINFVAGNVAAAQGFIQAIVPQTCADSYHKIVGNIYANTWALNIFTFSSADSATLTNIALQNPLVCGTAIYDARTMLGINVNDFITGQQNMVSRMAPADASGINQPDMTGWKGVMYPNPAMNEAWYETTLKEGESGRVIICDLLGRDLMSKDLNAGNNKLRFDISSLIDGVYVYKVIVNSVPLQNNKLIIQR